MIACPCSQVKTASLYPFANLKTICVQQQVMSLHFTTLCFIFALYVKHAYLSLGLICACKHANRVSEHTFHVGTLGF